MNQQKVEKIFQLLHKSIPHPKSELNYKSNFELLIAVILSAHTTDKSVNIATEKLFKVANTPKKILALGEDKLKQYIKNVGLHNAKASSIIKTSKILIDQFNSDIPNSREELEALPGVGRKTANVVLNTAFHQPVIAVDTHVFRVANRLGMAVGKNPKEVEEKLLKVIPKKFLPIAHYLLVLHGRYVCKAQRPLCAACVIKDLCAYYASLKRG